MIYFSMPKILLLALFAIASSITKLNAQIIVVDVNCIKCYDSNKDSVIIINTDSILVQRKNDNILLLKVKIFDSNNNILREFEINKKFYDKNDSKPTMMSEKKLSLKSLQRKKYYSVKVIYIKSGDKREITNTYKAYFAPKISSFNPTFIVE